MVQKKYVKEGHSFLIRQCEQNVGYKISRAKSEQIRECQQGEMYSSDMIWTYSSYSLWKEVENKGCNHRELRSAQVQGEAGFCLLLFSHFIFRWETLRSAFRLKRVCGAGLKVHDNIRNNQESGFLKHGCCYQPGIEEGMICLLRKQAGRKGKIIESRLGIHAICPLF